MYVMHDTSIFKRFELENRVPVFIQDSPIQVSEACGVSVVFRGCGSCADPREFPGLAHMTEHMMLLGSAGFPGVSEIETPFLRRGGYIDAYTTQHCMVFWFSTSRESLEEGLEILSDVIRFPRFEETALAIEKNVIVSESQKTDDDNETYRQKIFLDHFYAEDPHYAHLPSGDPKKIGEISSQHLVRFHESYIQAGHMGIVCAGHLPDQNTLLELLKIYFGNIKNKERLIICYPALPEGVTVEKRLPVIGRSSLTIAFPVEIYGIEGRYILNLLKYCLDGDSDAPLPRVLRYKHGFVHDTSDLCQFVGAPDHGFFEITLRVQKKDFDQAAQLAMDAFKGLEETRFEETKRRLLQNRRMLFIPPLEAQQRAIDAFVLGEDVLSLQEEEELITSITWEDIKRWKVELQSRMPFILKLY